MADKLKVKLVHPSDPEKKVVKLYDHVQEEAFRKAGFIDEAELQDLNENKDESSDSDLQKQLEDTQKKLEETKAKLAQARKDLKAEQAKNQTDQPDTQPKVTEPTNPIKEETK
jgi:hypothetical protein